MANPITERDKAAIYGALAEHGRHPYLIRKRVTPRVSPSCIYRYLCRFTAALEAYGWARGDAYPPMSALDLTVHADAELDLDDEGADPKTVAKWCDRHLLDLQREYPRGIPLAGYGAAA